MTKTHWKKLQNPDYLGSYALQPGEEIVLTIKSIAKGSVIGADGKKSEEAIMHFKETGLKPMILNATNQKIIQKIYKTPYIEDWVDKKIQIYVAQVKAFGDIVDALRIRPFIPQESKQEKEFICEKCGKPIKAHGSFTADSIAATSKEKFGKTLCFACATSKQEADNATSNT